MGKIVKPSDKAQPKAQPKAGGADRRSYTKKEIESDLKIRQQVAKLREQQKKLRDGKQTEATDGKIKALVEDAKKLRKGLVTKYRMSQLVEKLANINKRGEKKADVKKPAQPKAQPKKEAAAKPAKIGRPRTRMTEEAKGEIAGLRSDNGRHLGALKKSAAVLRATKVALDSAKGKKAKAKAATEHAAAQANHAALGKQISDNTKKIYALAQPLRNKARQEKAKAAPKAQPAKEAPKKQGK